MISIIGIYGRKGTGKDFIGRLIQETVYAGPKDFEGMYPRAECYAWADPIKQYCIDVLGIPSDLCYGTDDDKNMLTDYLWDRMPFPTEKKGKMTIREVIQVVGTELGRNVWGDKIWIGVMKHRIDEFHFERMSGVNVVIVTDCRFPNEVEAIREWGGKIWGIDGPQRIQKSSKKDDHPTERVPDHVKVDFTVCNKDGTTSVQIKEQILAELARNGIVQQVPAGPSR